MASTVTVKTFFQDDCRRFNVNNPSNYETLQQKIKEVYKFTDDEFLLKYKDTDGDLVTITNDSELTEMFSCLQIQATTLAVIKLEIFSTKQNVHIQQHQQQQRQNFQQDDENDQEGNPQKKVDSDPESAPILSDNPPSYYRGKFASDYSDQDILDVLRDISWYISTRESRVQSRVSSEKSLITPKVMSKVAATIPASNGGTLVSKPKELDPNAFLHHGNVTKWSVQTVGDWLKSSGFPEWQTIFKENDVSGDVLVELNHEILKEMGIISTGKRVKLLKMIEQLKSTSSHSSSKLRNQKQKSMYETPSRIPKGMRS